MNNSNKNSNTHTTVQIPNYQIISTLYSGSRTLVYRAVRTPDQLPVIIKLLKNEYPTFSELVQFRNQYTIAKNLKSHLIIQTYSLNPYQNGYALVMEDFGGISLHEWAVKAKNLLSLREFLFLAISLCNALDILYRERIIHKDIKPSNILINPDTKQVKLIDFSIASLLPRETQTLVNPNVLEGTLAYMSPEQTGRMNRGIDYRTDFYSLGVTFYELLTGKLPFESSDPMELVHSHIAKATPLVDEINPQIPSVLSSIVMKLMAKNAEYRYQSALGVKFDLEKCLIQLKETGQIEEFEIASRDVCDRFIIPDKLYGRESEASTLLEAFERVANPPESPQASGGHRGVEMMLVAGFSGIGKTAVVNEVHKPIVRQRGYFIKGKYDQFNRNIPFSAFVQALRDLMGQLLSESDTQLLQWKEKILSALGENGQVLIDFIPQLEKIIGKQPAAPELGGSDALNRFNLLFGKFIALFATQQHPLVMFLDDLQWADSASLSLMQVLMSQSEVGYLLTIGAYRDNEVFPAHPLMLTLEKMKKDSATISTLTLAPLSQSHVNLLVADTLSCTKVIAQPLSELVYQKTKGNPFFATQFLKALHQDGYIAYDFNVGHWQCDIAAVKLLSLTDDVVEFMALELQKLPDETQNVLKLAACIGAQFDLETLAIVSEQSPIDAATALWKALQEGMILPASQIYKFFQGTQQSQAEETVNPSYRFLHDRVQQAAYSLIPDDRKQTTHYQIGKLWLEQISGEAREDRIFEIVNQLNYGTTLINEQTEKEEVASLNLIACRKARSATAYQAGREYANTGLLLLGEGAWERQYELTLSFHDLAAELEMLCGDFDEMEKSIETVIARSRSLLEKVNVYCFSIQANTTKNKLNEANAIGVQFLQQLGVDLPENPTPEDVQQCIQEVSELIADKNIEDLIHLPVMTDARTLAIVQVANTIRFPSYLSGSPLFVLVISLSIKLCVRYGNVGISAYTYAAYSMIACNLLKDIDLAAQFCHLALNVVSKFDNKAVKPDILTTTGGFILHRKAHLKETLPLLSESYTLSLEVGNLQSAGYVAYFLCLHAFYCGDPLTTLEQDMRAYTNGLIQLNQLTPANYCRICWQSTLNLLGLTEHPTILSGSAFQEEEFLPALQSANDFIGLYLFCCLKLLLCFLFGEVELANDRAFEARNYLMAAGGTTSEAVFYFYDSLTALALLSQLSDEISTVLERVAQNQTQLKQWAHNAPMNHQHKVDLVEAEKCRVLGQKAEAIELYERAISGAKTNEYIQEEAIANELAAKFYLEWGKEKVAAGYMQEAYYCYSRWGAKAKIIDLEKRYPRFLEPIVQQPKYSFDPLNTLSTITNSSTKPSSASSSISDSLDFASVIKAAQTISSTIQLQELLQQLTQIILQSSGADKCVLVLPQEDTWQVRAISTPETTDIYSELLEDFPDIPVKLIQYVKRTETVVIIDNLDTDLPVIGDYLHQHQPKSFFGLPILNQGHLVGILYLENRATAGVFTIARLTVIEFLCTQAAISLANANLYQQAQVYARQLEQSQLQLVQSEKMSALGNLVAGVAHEINNPVGFLSGNIQPALDYINDLFGVIDLVQQKYPQIDAKIQAEIQSEIEAIDLDYIREDLPKLVGSMREGIKRIKDISTSLRTFSRADTDRPVSCNVHEGIDSTILILKHRLKASESRPEIKVIKEYGNLPNIECYAGQLNQVFMNILANAIDALDESNRVRSYKEIKQAPNRITISTSLEDKYVRIAIADNGTGMPEDVKQRIYDHLFTTKSVGKGTGLGLAIAQQIIVEKHHGTITVNSELGKGTEFIIVLPIGN